MTPESPNALRDTVDPKTVTLAGEKSPGSGNGASAVGLAGRWTMSVDAGGQIVDLSVEFKASGSEFIGSMVSAVGGGSFEKVQVAGNKVKGTLLAEIQGQPMTIPFTGTIEGEKMTGSFDVPGIGVAGFTAVRTK